MAVFKRYAEYYDRLYQDKDYASECDFITEVIQENTQVPVKNIIDLGCGTANHGILLAQKGYHVTGVDVSEVMLKYARDKSRHSQSSMEFHHSDLRTFRLNTTFDAAICMFSVLGYITENSEFENMLRNVRNHLKKGAVFVFDVWNGLAVMKLYPEVRIKRVTTGDLQIIRMVEPELDAFSHICHNHYQMIVIEGDKVIDDIKENHAMRFFFPQEICILLESTGFEVLRICTFPQIMEKVDESTWNMAIVARAVAS